MTTRRENGFVLLGVLLLAVIVTSVTMGYARSALLAGDAAPITQPGMIVQTAVDSGLVFAERSLLAGTAPSGAIATADGLLMDLAVTDSAPDLRSIAIHSEHAGHERTVNALAEVHLSTGDALPTLSDAARAAVLASPMLVPITSDTTYNGVIVEGLLLVSKGRTLTLQNVILKGAVVSENALSDAAWSESDRIAVHLRRSVLIEPTGTLAGCSIVAPDADVIVSDDPRLQIHGVVVATKLRVTDPSAEARLHRPLVVGQLVGASFGLVELNTGRAPLPWPAALQAGSQGLRRVVFPQQQVSAAQVSAIKGFDFAAPGGGPGPAPAGPAGGSMAGDFDLPDESPGP